jgi:hypothetical protein
LQLLPKFKYILSTPQENLDNEPFENNNELMVNENGRITAAYLGGSIYPSALAQARVLSDKLSIKRQELPHEDCVI